MLSQPSVAASLPQLIPDGVLGQDATPPTVEPYTSGGLNPYSWGMYAAMTADPSDPYGLSLYDPRAYGDYDPSAENPVSYPVMHGEHGPKYPNIRFPENLLGVVRPVGRKEIQSTPKAEESLVTEWTRLRKINTWEEDKVMESSQVRKSLCPGVINHVGRIFEICAEKNAELPESDPRRKFKGRVVFQGNQAWDSNFDYAIFQE